MRSRPILFCDYFPTFFNHIVTLHIHFDKTLCRISYNPAERFYVMFGSIALKIATYIK